MDAGRGDVVFQCFYERFDCSLKIHPAELLDPTAFKEVFFFDFFFTCLGTRWYFATPQRFFHQSGWISLTFCFVVIGFLLGLLHAFFVVLFVKVLSGHHEEQECVNKTQNHRDKESGPFPISSDHDGDEGERHVHHALPPTLQIEAMDAKHACKQGQKCSYNFIFHTKRVKAKTKMASPN